MNGDGHILRAAEFSRESDQEAVRHAEDQRGEQALELWSGARVVAKFPRLQDA